MKILNVRLLSAVFFSVVAAAYGSVASVSVTVFDSGHKVAYKGKTGAGGTFATGKLATGEYTVQFNSEGLPAGNYALVISAGKEKVMAEAVPNQKFGKGGVAMRIKVGNDMNVTGQVSSGKAGEVATTGGNTKVKIVDGKRWIWVSNSATGSNIGGHWVEEGSPEARNVQGISRDGVTRMQDRGPAGLSGN